MPAPINSSYCSSKGFDPKAVDLEGVSAEDMRIRICAARQRLGDLKAIHSQWYDAPGHAFDPADIIRHLEEAADSAAQYLEGVEGWLSKQAKFPKEKAETDLHAKMRDPRYWRDRDPDFVAEVIEGYRQLFEGDTP